MTCRSDLPALKGNAGRRTDRSMDAYDIIIPARYQSTRLPGKLLKNICGKSMIQRVVEGAQCSAAEQIFVATDDDRIANEVLSSTSAQVCLTDSNHANGTDRVSQAAGILKLDDRRIVVNVQGDEPLIDGQLIDQVVETLLASECADVATAAKPFSCEDEWNDAAKVKCIIDSTGHAIYFSRSAIPWRETCGRALLSLRHIGIYAYMVGYLKMHSHRRQCELEQSERLEQLRVLHYGDKIAVRVVNDCASFGVDTEEDLQRMRIAVRASMHEREYESDE